MQSSESSESCWRRAYTIRPVWLNILSEAADLVVLAKESRLASYEKM